MGREEMWRMLVEWKLENSEKNPKNLDSMHYSGGIWICDYGHGTSALAIWAIGMAHCNFSIELGLPYWKVEKLEGIQIK